MVIKADELKNGMVLKYKGEFVKFIKFTPTMITFLNDLNRLGRIKLKKGWNFRFDYTDITEREFEMYLEKMELKRENGMLENQANYFMGRTRELEQDIKNEYAKKKIRFPVWFRIKRNSRICTNDFIKDFIKSIQPHSDSIYLDWGTNDDKEYPISLLVKKSKFDCTEKHLSDLLVAIQPYSNIIHIEYGRY